MLFRRFLSENDPYAVEFPPYTGHFYASVFFQKNLTDHVHLNEILMHQIDHSADQSAKDACIGRDQKDIHLI